MIFGNMAVFARSLHLGRFAFAALFLFLLVGSSWASCNRGNIPINYCSKCSYGTGSGCSANQGRVNCSLSVGDTYTISGRFCVVVSEANCFNANIYFCSQMGSSAVPVPQANCCDNECEIDSVKCVNDGYSWDPDPSAECGKSCSSCDEQCQCEEQGMIWTGTECIEDTTVCNTYREECQRAKGVFNGSVNSGQCVATCNQCKELNRLVRLKQNQCCNQGLAPPDSVRRCTIEARNTPGMNWSTYTTSDNEFACQDPSLSDAASSRYVEMCFEQSSSSEGPSPGSSSSGEGGTSSGGGASSGGAYGDCQECPWLDSILDTLTRTKKNTDDIVTCLTTPNLCAGLSIQIPDSIKTPVFAFDTAFRKYLKPLMDSSLKLDSNQLKALMKLDTNLLKQMKNDSAALKNDTNTWRVVEGAGDQVDTSIHSMNDTTRKWFKRIADSIGVSTDSLAAHLDSIVRHIPDSVLDSIVKYQQYATDNFDSVLFGHGKGFSLVDSLIDSSVKYFKESNQIWNEYVSMYGDSTQKIHEEIIDLPGRNASAIGSALGYGDTASTNLRGDLNGIREAIEGLGDTNGLGAAMGGAGGSGTGPDTSGYGSYVTTMSGRFANLARDASGGAWGDSASLETVFAATSADSVDPDSASEIEHRIWMDSATALLSRRRDTLMRDTALLSKYYDTLKTEMQFFNFDSVILAPLREALPATNSCPEDCFKGEVDIGVTHTISTIEVNYGLCRKWFGDADIFMLFRVLLRLVTALTCVYIGAWYIANRKV